MSDILDRIVAVKREEVARRKATTPLPQLRDRLRAHARSDRRDFRAALQRDDVAIIAEIKRRSPSAGVIASDVDVPSAAAQYEAGGAAAISVLTDAPFFGGRDEDLAAARQRVRAPLLRKDFVIDAYQLSEASAIGADAVLLIVRILSDAELREFIATARELGLAALVEAHDEREIERAGSAGADIIGVNARDLATFKVDLHRVIELRELIPPAAVAVAESGVSTRQDVLDVKRAGYQAVLVGEALMRAPNPLRKLRELRGESE